MYTTVVPDDIFSVIKKHTTGTNKYIIASAPGNGGGGPFALPMFT